MNKLYISRKAKDNLFVGFSLIHVNAVTQFRHQLRKKTISHPFTSHRWLPSSLCGTYFTYEKSSHETSLNLDSCFDHNRVEVSSAGLRQPHQCINTSGSESNNSVIKLIHFFTKVLDSRSRVCTIGRESKTLVKK